MTSDSGRRVVVTGATGRIGSAVVARCASAATRSRDADRARQRLGAGVEAHAWRQPVDERPPRDALAGASS